MPAKHSRRNRARNQATSARPAPRSDGIPTAFYCSGVCPPAHLRPERGYVYPQKAMRNGCSDNCPHYLCYGPPPGMRDPDDVTNWLYHGCAANDCDGAELLLALARDVGRLPDNVVVNPKRQDSDVDGVFAFLVTDDDSQRVFVFDISILPAGPNKRLCQCSSVLAASRRMAFGALTDAIEASASALTDAQYKALYDAAKAAHDAGVP